MLQKEFVPPQESSELKELGFNEPCLKFYAAGKLVLGLDTENGDTNSKINGYNPLYVSAPTFSQAFRWFREKYNLKEQFGVFPHHTIMFNYIIGGGKEEEAELACLRKLIEIIKEGNNEHR
jgi:hypothetical protein